MRGVVLRVVVCGVVLVVCLCVTCFSSHRSRLLSACWSVRLGVWGVVLVVCVCVSGVLFCVDVCACVTCFSFTGADSQRIFRAEFSSDDQLLVAYGSHARPLFARVLYTLPNGDVKATVSLPR